MPELDINAEIAERIMGWIVWTGENGNTATRSMAPGLGNGCRTSAS